MTKKKITKKKSTKKTSRTKVINAIGTPTALLLPARNYKFKVFTETHTMTVPKEGKYVDLDGKLFAEKDGEFDFLRYSEEDKAYTLFIPALSKVLFGTSQYPDMKDNQAFTPISITVKEDGVEILGNLIEMVQEN
jgi:hypothetical protein